MCHSYCIKWGVENLNLEEVQGKRVIEVGSYDVNGSFRYFIEKMNPREYIGVDITKGPGVNVICPAENLVNCFSENYFDLVISTCVLEHVRDWKSAISNIKRVCRPNGIIIVIAPSVWPLHEFPYDFWRFEKKDIENIFSDCLIIELQEILRTPYLLSLFYPRMVLVYTKIKKPTNFCENSLQDYKLYSIILNKKIREIPSDYKLGEKISHLPFVKFIKHGIILLLYKLQKIFLKQIYVDFLIWKYKKRQI